MKKEPFPLHLLGKFSSIPSVFYPEKGRSRGAKKNKVVWKKNKKNGNLIYTHGVLRYTNVFNVFSKKHQKKS